MRYTGPAKPTKTESIHPVDNRVGKAIFIAALILVLCADLFYWRPG